METPQRTRDLKEYQVWGHLKQHARRTGSAIDPRWSSFTVFLEDMGYMPPGTNHLARYKLDKAFSKENCVWAGHSETMKTKRTHTNNKTGIKGLALKRERGVVKCYQAHIASEKMMYSKRFPLTNEGFLCGVAWLVLMREEVHGTHANHFIPADILEEANPFFSETTVLDAVDYSLKHPSIRQ